MLHYFWKGIQEVDFWLAKIDFEGKWLLDIIRYVKQT